MTANITINMNIIVNMFADSLSSGGAVALAVAAKGNRLNATIINNCANLVVRNIIS